MSLEEIKAAGLQVDLPYESGSTGDFPGLQYDDTLGPEYGWDPPEGYRVRHVDYEIPGSPVLGAKPAVPGDEDEQTPVEPEPPDEEGIES
jgi:hypothetical protein